MWIRWSEVSFPKILKNTELQITSETSILLRAETEFSLELWLLRLCLTQEVVGSIPTARGFLCYPSPGKEEIYDVRH